MDKALVHKVHRERLHSQTLLMAILMAMVFRTSLIQTTTTMAPQIQRIQTMMTMESSTCSILTTITTEFQTPVSTSITMATASEITLAKTTHLTKHLVAIQTARQDLIVKSIMTKTLTMIVCGHSTKITTASMIGWTQNSAVPLVQTTLETFS